MIHSLASPYTAKPLPCEQIDRAFPLAQLIAPDLTLDRWRSHAERLTDPGLARADREGIIVLEGDSGYYFGLFNYAEALDMLHGRSLLVDHFVVLHFIETSGPRRIMISKAEDIARRRQCGAIHISLAPRRYAAEPEHCGIARFLHEEGYRTWGHRWSLILRRDPTG